LRARLTDMGQEIAAREQRRRRCAHFTPPRSKAVADHQEREHPGRVKLATAGDGNEIDPATGWHS